MWLFGHLGLGYKMTSPRGRKLPLKPLLIGCLLPDLIDKPLYLLFGQKITLISGTRTFGHTLLFLAVISCFYACRRSQSLLAVILGTLTHLFLDFFSKLEVSSAKASQYVHAVLLWPLWGTQFPRQDLTTWRLWTDLIPSPLVLACEFIGLLLIIRSYSKEGWKTELWRKDRQ